MNKDVLQSLIIKVLLMILSPLAVKLHVDGSTITAIATDLADAGVLAWGVYRHWNMVRVPAPATGANPPVNMSAALLLFCLLPLLGGCANCPNCSFGQQFQANLTKLNGLANTYGPIIGKDIIMVANILVQAECSPALASASGTAANVLNIVAPTSSAANTVKTVLSTNLDVASQLCPFVAAIKASAGTVPQTAPSQIVLPPSISQ